MRILKEDLDMVNSSENNASTQTNLHRPKDQTYFQTKSSNCNKIPARIRTRNRGVLSNLKDATDYHPSKMNRNLHHGPGIIHPYYNSNEQTSYTVPVIVSGDVETEDSVNVIGVSMIWKTVLMVHRN